MTSYQVTIILDHKYNAVDLFMSKEVSHHLKVQRICIAHKLSEYSSIIKCKVLTLHLIKEKYSESLCAIQIR